MPKKISSLAIFVCALGLLLVASSAAAFGATASNSTQVVVPRGQPGE